MSPSVERVLEVLFFLSAAVLVYVYVGYPLLLAFFTRFEKVPEATPASLPMVTLLISAYNERAVIESKLDNSLELDYPTNLLRILVISDCSDDGTDEVVGKYLPSGIRLARQQQRLGKSAGLNLGVRHSEGEIIVFSDANALYKADAIRQLVKHFANPKVGYVVGNARYLQKESESQSAASEGLYWKLETWLKQRESLFHSVIGGDGAIYAIRKSLYSPLRDTDISDFLNPLQIVDRGYIGIFEPLAISYEETAESFDKEYRRKVRIISQSMNALHRVPGVLNPMREPRHWVSLMSHKLLRWLAPFFMIALFFSSLLLWHLMLFRIAFACELAFCAMVALGWLGRNKSRTWRGFSLAYYFWLVNLASLVGCIKCWRGDLSGVWTPPRQNEANEV